MPQNRDRRRALTLGLGAAALPLTSLLGPRAAAALEPLRIGLIASYTGPYSDYGQQMDNGVALYLQRNGGKIAGRGLQIIKKDTGGPSPENAIRFARELVVRDKAHVIVGLDFSPNAIAIGPVATEAKIPVIVMNAASSVVTTRSPFIARVSFTVAQVSAPMALWALKNGIKEVSTIVSDYSSGVDAEKAFATAFTAGGGKIANSLRAPLNNPDFAAYVQRLKDERPQAVFIFFPSGPQPTAFMKAFKERGLDAAGITLIGTGEATDDSFLQAQGDVALGVVTAHHYSFAHPSALNRSYVADYAKAFGAKLRPSYMSVAAYDGMAALAAALEKTEGAVDGERIMAALKGLKLESPRGPIEIDAETRDIVQTIYIRRVEKIDGQYVNVEFDKFDAVKDPGKTP
ncbi:MAG: ABC transporter substrate-binding protein [Elsteraceae bacterium]